MTTTINKSKETPRVAMTVFKVENLDNWRERIMSATVQGGGKALRKGSGCILWNPRRILSMRGTLKYVDGVKVVREWLGPKVSALAILPRRMFFEDDSDLPSSKPEWMLVGDSKPALAPPVTRIRTCIDFAGWLAERMSGFDPNPLPVSRIRTALHESTRMVFGDGSEGIPGQKASVLLTRLGFHSVPENMRIELIVEDISNAQAKYYQRLIIDAFRRCKCAITVPMVSYDEMRTRLSGGDTTIEPMHKGYCALVAVAGKKGQPLSPMSNMLIETLQSACVPFRMFSLDNKSLNWSALDQVGSVLMGAGGIPYALKLPWPANVEPPYILGVDLGHPKATRASWVVMSLMDHRGILIENWRRRQERDETIGPAILRAGLTWARKAAHEHAGGHDTGFLVIRDGRLHAGETVNMYKRILGGRMTLVELAKYDNPEMFIPGASPRPAPAGTECLPAGSVTPFLVPVSPRLANDLSRTLKLHMAPSWDGLGVGMDNVCELVTGLSYSPGLGLATHALPGPIYWADGIAAISETNHQFAGQNIAESK